MDLIGSAQSIHGPDPASEPNPVHGMGEVGPVLAVLGREHGPAPSPTTIFGGYFNINSHHFPCQISQLVGNPTGWMPWLHGLDLAHGQT